MKLAKPLGARPRELADELAAALGEPSTASPRSTSPAPASSTSRSTRPPRARSPRTIVDAGEAYGRGTRYDGRADQPRVRLREPHRPHPHRRHPLGRVGDSLARILAGAGRRRHPRVLLQRPRRADRPLRRAACSPRHLGEPTPEDGYGGDYIAEIAARVVAAYPGDLDALPRDEAQEVFRARRASSSCSARSSRRCTTSASTSTSTSTRTRSTSRGAVEHAVARLRELGPHLRGGRRHLAAHHRLRRRPRPRRHQERRRGRLHLRRPRLLPQQARARLRAQHHHARRRPPRLRRPADGDGRPRSATPRTSTSRS